MWHVRCKSLVIEITLVVSWFVCAVVHGDVLHVPGDHPTIQAAITAATPGSQILVEPGTYSENINFAGKPLTLRSSEGPERTILSGSGSSRVIVCNMTGTNEAWIEGFTITRTSGSGGGITITGLVTLKNCNVKGHTASSGSGLQISSGAPAIIDCVFENNTSTATSGGGGGGAIVTGGTPIFTNCTFRNNTGTASSGRGAGVRITAGQPQFVGCHFENNVLTGSTSRGAAVAASGNATTAVFTDCTFTANSAFQAGGAIYATNNGSLAANASIFHSNMTQQWGGAVYSDGGMREFFESEFISNSAGLLGGALAVSQSVCEVHDCLFLENNALDGGALWIRQCETVIAGTVIEGNSAIGDDGRGGGMYIYECLSLTMTGVTLRSNTASWFGGMRVHSSPLTMTDSVIEGNSSANSGGGGQVWLASPLLLHNISVTGNTAGWGGGLAITDCTFSVTDSVFEGNASTGNAGALNVWGGSVGHLERVEFVGNTGGLAAGLDVHASEVAVADCVFARNVSVSSGGAVRAREGASLTVQQSEFLGNSAGWGGGVFADDSHVTLYQSSMWQNAALHHGGAIYMQSATLQLEQCVLAFNQAMVGGGAIHMRNSSKPAMIDDCTFRANRANYGGAIDNDNAGSTITNSIFQYNLANVQGGSIYTFAGAGPTIAFTTFCASSPNHIVGSWNPLDGVSASPSCSSPLNIHIPNDVSSFEWAIALARSGSEIQVGPGVYHEAIDPMGKAVAIRSTHGPELTIIDVTPLGTNAVRFISGEGVNTILDGLTITGGSAFYGGGVHISQLSNPTLMNCVISGNVATFGGGINIWDSSPTLINCVIENNVAVIGGGIAHSTAFTSLDACELRGNYASQQGGAVANFDGSQPTILNSLIAENHAGGAGGGIFSSASSLPAVAGTVFCGNLTTHIAGPWSNQGNNALQKECITSTPGDLNDDGVVDVLDLLILLSSWGTCPRLPAACPGDLNGDHAVDVLDLLILLSNWG